MIRRLPRPAQVGAPFTFFAIIETVAVAIGMHGVGALLELGQIIKAILVGVRQRVAYAIQRLPFIWHPVAVIIGWIGEQDHNRDTRADIALSSVWYLLLPIPPISNRQPTAVRPSAPSHHRALGRWVNTRNWGTCCRSATASPPISQILPPPFRRRVRAGGNNFL